MPSCLPWHQNLLQWLLGLAHCTHLAIPAATATFLMFGMLILIIMLSRSTLRCQSKEHAAVLHITVTYCSQPVLLGSNCNMLFQAQSIHKCSHQANKADRLEPDT